jgi:methyl-accepting chemotaxis protein
MNGSIRGKMLLALVATTGISVVMSKSAQRQLAYSQAQEIARHYASQFDGQMMTYQTVGQTLAATMSHYQSGNRDEVTAMLRQLLDDNPEALGTYVGYEPNAFDKQDAKFVSQPANDATGRFIPYWNKLTGAVTLDPLADYDTSDYYLLPKQTLKPQVLEPYLYQGVLMTSYISPIIVDGKFQGIAGIDVSLNSLNDLIGKIRVFDTGYAFLVSNSGTFVAFGDKSLIGEKTLGDFAAEKKNPELQKVAEGIKAGQEGYVDGTDPLTGKSAAMFYAPISTGNWGMVVVVPTAEMLAGAQRLTQTLVVAGVLALAITVVALFVVALIISRPIKALHQAVERIALGDLDVEVPALRSRDEIARMSAAFGRMVAYLRDVADATERVAAGDLTREVTPQSEQDVLGHAVGRMIVNLRGLIGQVTGGAEQLHSASEEMAQAADQAGNATSQVTTAIQQVAAGTATQASSATQMTSTVDDIARRVEGVARDVETQGQAVQAAVGSVAELEQQLEAVTGATASSSTAARQVAETAQAGAQAVDGMVRGIESIRANALQVGERVREMGQHSEEIGKIVSTIQDIADQTNLLALNAAIEAARAGEQGRGFAVVADEVRKLAEKAGASSRQIAALVQTVQRSTEQAMRATAASADNVEAGVQGAARARQALQQILVATHENEQSVRNIQAAAASIQALADRVVVSLRVMAEVGDKNATATRQMSTGIGDVVQAVESVAAASEENSASVEEVSATAEELSAQVEEVAASAQALASLANGLRGAVSVFRLNTEVSDFQPARNAVETPEHMVQRL